MHHTRRPCQLFSMVGGTLAWRTHVSMIHVHVHLDAGRASEQTRHRANVEVSDGLYRHAQRLGDGLNGGEPLQRRVLRDLSHQQRRNERAQLLRAAGFHW